MMRVVRPEEVPFTASMRDKEEGIRLQKRANAMLMNGDISDEYLAIRRAAEEHLGIWDWQAKVPTWKLVGSTDKTMRPKACCEIGEEKLPCAYLPSGSRACKSHDCPSA